ncbi:MAG TPA: hypothetical protein EYP41_06450 [Anaerolineae bacterium]|nr:hypothetical protein [Anaerolineae bacterium]
MRNLFRGTIGVVGLILLLAACGGQSAYVETFDEVGNWRTDSDSEVAGVVENGVYDFTIFADELTSWTTAGENFKDGLYEVEATQVDGPDNNAFGMLFRLDDQNDNFYAFQISGDGFVWIGRYRNGIAEEPIINDWWFESTAVKPGDGATNKLSVRAEGQNLIFLVNDIEVGRVSDDAFPNGDIGLMVRSLGQPNVHVQFDNFTVTPLEK